MKLAKSRSIQAFALLAASLVSASASAGNIAYGKVLGVQVFDSATDKLTRIYFDGSNATQHGDTAKCHGTSPSGQKYIFADIQHASHSPEAVAEMASVALAAYMANKKARAYSYSADSCNADMVSVQEFYI